MDTSETYIKMRVAAIPDLGKGLLIESPCNHMASDVWVDSKGDWYYATESRVCQLDRQDQLQEMVGYSDIHSLMMHFWDFIGYDHICTSLEQLWLAFVMKEKYNKTWNGENWNGKQT